MWYKGQRHTLPSSRYAGALGIMEAMQWTYQEYLDQPADLIDELEIRLEKRAAATQRKE
jgi:hypothetical protein